MSDKTPGPDLLWQYKDGEGLDVPCTCGANSFKHSNAEDGWECMNCHTNFATMQETRDARETASWL